MDPYGQVVFGGIGVTTTIISATFSLFLKKLNNLITYIF